MLLTVAGSSCSGKSIAARGCANIDNLLVHDFDEVGVPSSADVIWRQRSLEDWIGQVLRHQADGVDVLLTGQSPLGEILASPSAPRLNGIAACLMDVDDRQRWQRLERRDPGRWDRTAKRALVGWARWHRNHAHDPQRRPEVITASAWDQMRWDRWATWTSSDPRWQVTVIDTTDHTVDRTTEALGSWVRASRQAAGSAWPASGRGHRIAAPRVDQVRHATH